MDAALESSTAHTTLQHILISFYECYSPSKVDAVPVILQRFRGKEIELLTSLKHKYNLESYPPFDEFVRHKGVGSSYEQTPFVKEVLLTTISR